MLTLYFVTGCKAETEQEGKQGVTYCKVKQISYGRLIRCEDKSISSKQGRYAFSHLIILKILFLVEKFCIICYTVPNRVLITLRFINYYL